MWKNVEERKSVDDFSAVEWKMWKSLEECGRVWKSLEECGRAELFEMCARVEECGRMWKHTVWHKVWKSVQEECGRVSRVGKSVEPHGSVRNRSTRVCKSVEEWWKIVNYEMDCLASLFSHHRLM